MKRILLLALIGLVIVGCASIIKGKYQQVPITSVPSGASIVIYDVRTSAEVGRGTSPYTVTLKRGTSYFNKGIYRVVLEKDEYRRKEVMLQGTANGWYIAGNIFLGGLIGWLIVDPITGAMWTLRPEIINVGMEVASLPKTEGLHVVLMPKGDLPLSVQEKLEPVY